MRALLATLSAVCVVYFLVIWWIWDVSPFSEKKRKIVKEV